MKLSIAATVLVYTSGVVAFQQPISVSSSLRRDVGLRAIAIDPTETVIPTQTEEEKKPEIDMTGIALSVSFDDKFHFQSETRRRER